MPGDTLITCKVYTECSLTLKWCSVVNAFWCNSRIALICNQYAFLISYSKNQSKEINSIQDKICYKVKKKIYIYTFGSIFLLFIEFEVLFCTKWENTPWLYHFTWKSHRPLQIPVCMVCIRSKASTFAGPSCNTDIFEYPLNKTCLSMANCSVWLVRRYYLKSEIGLHVNNEILLPITFIRKNVIQNRNSQMHSGITRNIWPGLPLIIYRYT